MQSAFSQLGLLLLASNWLLDHCSIMDDPPRARILAVLPPEVLHRIFEFAGEDAYSVQREAMRIARVCHEFQHVFSLYPIRHWALKSENEILTLSAKVVALEEARVSGEGGDETMNSLEVVRAVSASTSRD